MGYRVLITAPALAPRAMRMLKERGIDAETMRLGASTDEVLAAIDRVQPDGIVSRTAPLTADAIAAAHRLKAISKHGAGVDNIDIEAASAAGIPVARTMGANAQSVAEHTAALMLSLGRRIVQTDIATKNGEWPRSKFIGVEFHGRTLGLLGYGEIARRFAPIARGIGMRVVVFSPSLVGRGEIDGLEVADSLEALCAVAGVLSIHCALNDKTRGMVDARHLAMLPEQAIVLNTARGAIIDESALIDALTSGRIAGAGLDTFADEPLAADSPLCSLDNVVLTPHVAGSTVEAMERVAVEAVSNLLAMLEGKDLPPEALVVSKP